MTTLKIIEGITSFVADNICSKIKLKLPDDTYNDNRYHIKMVTPAAFPLYVPGKDRVPPNVEAPIPSIAVQLLEGSDDLVTGQRKLKIRLCLATWNPGKHPGETLYAVEDDHSLFGVHYENNPEGESYSRNSDGWKDLYNFQDIALGELEGTEFFAGVRVDMTEPITYGPFTEEGTIWDYYPYWCGWVAFSVICGVPQRRSEDIRKYLN